LKYSAAIVQMALYICSCNCMRSRCIMVRWMEREISYNRTWSFSEMGDHVLLPDF